MARLYGNPWASKLVDTRPRYTIIKSINELLRGGNVNALGRQLTIN